MYFKQQLIKINEQEAERFNHRAFSLWDYSGYNQFSTEKVPFTIDDTPNSEWFWEKVHYKQKLGDLILDRTFELNSDHFDKQAFGVQLTSSNLRLMRHY